MERYGQAAKEVFVYECFFCFELKRENPGLCPARIFQRIKQMTEPTILVFSKAEMMSRLNSVAADAGGRVGKSFFIHSPAIFNYFCSGTEKKIGHK